MDTPSASSSSTAIADAEPTMIRRRTILWPGGPAIKQHFSLPESIIYYIAMNPSTPEGYNKLIQTCKYFFEVNPILVAATMTEKVICSDDECYGNGECCVKIDIKKITSKIWLTQNLNLRQQNIPNFAALLRPKIYRCDIVFLNIAEALVDFDDFKFFSLSVEQVLMYKTQIVSKNGSPVMLENILEVLPNLEGFVCFFKNNAPMVSASTAKNISKLRNLGNLEYFKLTDIDQSFNLDDFFAFMKDRGIEFRLWFPADNISDEYKNQLDQIIDSIIETPHLKAVIRYYGQDQEKADILNKRFYK